MDSDHYTCGTCRHGNLQDNCGQCEKEAAAELMQEYEVQTVAHFTCPKCGRRWAIPCEQTISIDFYGECIPCRFVPVGGNINKHGSGAGTAEELDAISAAAPKPEEE